MAEQAATIDPDKRRALFVERADDHGREAPALYFAAPRLYTAHSTRVQGVVPSVMRPPVLWNVDLLSVRTAIAR